MVIIQTVCKRYRLFKACFPTWTNDFMKNHSARTFEETSMRIRITSSEPGISFLSPLYAHQLLNARRAQEKAHQRHENNRRVANDVKIAMRGRNMHIRDGFERPGPLCKAQTSLQHLSYSCFLANKLALKLCVCVTAE